MSAKPNHILLDLVGVLITMKGGKTVISKEVPEHEVRVLKEVHGDSNIEVQPLASDMEPDREYHANAHMEWARLNACYRERFDGEGSPVKGAFPQGVEALAAYGFTVGDAREVTQQPRSVSVNHTLEARKAAAAERKAQAKRVKHVAQTGDARVGVEVPDDDDHGSDPDVRVAMKELAKAKPAKADK